VHQSVHGAGTHVTACDASVTATKRLRCLVLVAVSLLCIAQDDTVPSVWTLKQKWVDSSMAGAWSDGIGIKVRGWLLGIVLAD